MSQNQDSLEENLNIAKYFTKFQFYKNWNLRNIFWLQIKEICMHQQRDLDFWYILHIKKLFARCCNMHQQRDLDFRYIL